ncbi:MAG: histidine kinase [Rhodocyclaceae bacterium]|nr:histidine kinase [Rhodocyclaceae bacterium]
MVSRWVIIASCLAYVGILFAVAYWFDQRAERGRLLANPWVYALSLGTYATAWTFYGSAGMAAVDGAAFLAIYLGASLAVLLSGTVMGRMVRAVQRYHVTSIADLAASRYGKSGWVGGAVALGAVIGLIPYLALQLKAISNTFLMLAGEAGASSAAAVPVLHDTAFYAVLLLAAFAILFGARRLSPAERHDGLVAAVAIVSVAKLLAALAIGVFVVFFLYQGVADLFDQAVRLPQYGRLIAIGGEGLSYGRWLALLVLGMLSVMLLPSQFHLVAVENRGEKHLYSALWLFPLYLLLITLFVLPVAFAGLLRFPLGAVEPDTFAIALPVAFGSPGPALLVFLGGLSAATAHVVVSTLALSILICNNLVLPLLLRLGWISASGPGHGGRRVLYLRRFSILLLLALAYGYLRLTGHSYALVQIGLVSFVAAAQFAPVVLGGLFWRHGNRRGALAGLILGFLAWAYTLVLPVLATSGWLPPDLVQAGPFGIPWLKPLALFGLEDVDWISHGLFWSLLANTGAYVGVSLAKPASLEERLETLRFIDGLAQDGTAEMGLAGRLASARDLHGLLARFLGPGYADEAMARFAQESGVAHWQELEPNADLVGRTESLLAGVIGAPSARILVDSVLRRAPVGTREVMEIVDETSHAIAHSHRLEQQSRQLEALAAALRESEERLEAIIDNAPAVIFMKDLEGRYLLINRQYESFILVGRENIKGKTDHDLYSSELADVYVRNDRRVLEAGKPLQMEETLPAFDGMRTYLAVKFPLRDVNGQVYALCGIATDITERKRAEEAIRDLNRDLAARGEQLEALNQELEAFSYSVSHDLRAPLRGLNGMTQILMEQYADRLDDTGRTYLEQIRKSSQRLSQLVDALLSLSLVSRGEMRREDVDLSEMVGKIADDLRAGQPERQVEFVIQAGVHAHGDPRLLRVVLDNLVGNAWKYSVKRPVGRIEFGTVPLEDGGQAYFVRDNGVGFDMQYADRLFKAFQRFHSPNEYPGSGIGLATVQRIVRRHGGRIWGEGAVDQGATFYFTLGP